MASGLVWPLSIVMQSPFPADVAQMPFGHDHELVEAFLLLNRTMSARRLGPLTAQNLVELDRLSARNTR